MTHTKTYPVTDQNVPQPHLTVVANKTEVNICSGWVAFVISGIIAIIFLLCIHYLGGTTLFPTTINLYANMVPIIKTGFLQVYPFTVDSNYSIQESFLVNLPLKKNEELDYQMVLDNLLGAYPDKYQAPYRNCWLENPTGEEPCFYDRSWINEFCRKDNAYGYQANEKDEFNPCFILKFDGTQDWVPEHLTHAPDTLEHFDRGFTPVVCVDQDQVRNATTGIEIYPPKGFSNLYFPVSKFNNSSYLPPLVAVKVNGVQRNSSFTIKCSILTTNAFELWNVGKVFITFSS